MHQVTKYKVGENFYQQQRKVVCEKCQKQQLKKAGGGIQQVFTVPSTVCEYNAANDTKELKIYGGGGWTGKSEGGPSAEQRGKCTQRHAQDLLEAYRPDS